MLYLHFASLRSEHFIYKQVSSPCPGSCKVRWQNSKNFKVPLIIAFWSWYINTYEESLQVRIASGKSIVKFSLNKLICSLSASVLMLELSLCCETIAEKLVPGLVSSTCSFSINVVFTLWVQVGLSQKFSQKWRSAMPISFFNWIA